MMLSPKRWRLSLHSRTPGDPFHDALTGSPPVVWRGNHLLIQFAVREPGPLGAAAALVTDFTGWGGVLVELRDGSTEAALIAPQKAITVAELDTTLTEETWADGTRQHGTAVFASDELTPVFHNRRRRAWLVLAMLDGAGQRVTLGAGPIDLVADSAVDGLPPPEVPILYPTKAEVIAMLGEKAAHADVSAEATARQAGDQALSDALALVAAKANTAVQPGDIGTAAARDVGTGAGQVPLAAQSVRPDGSNLGAQSVGLAALKPEVLDLIPGGETFPAGKLIATIHALDFNFAEPAVNEGKWYWLALSGTPTGANAPTDDLIDGGRAVSDGASWIVTPPSPVTIPDHSIATKKLADWAIHRDVYVTYHGQATYLAFAVVAGRNQKLIVGWTANGDQVPDPADAANDAIDAIFSPGGVPFASVAGAVGEPVWVFYQGSLKKIVAGYLASDGAKLIVGWTETGEQVPAQIPDLSALLADIAALESAVETLDLEVAELKTGAVNSNSIRLLPPEGWLWEEMGFRVLWSAARGYHTDFDPATKKVGGTNHYVDPTTGNDANNGLSWEAAKASLSSLLTAGNSSPSTPRTIHVRPGWYDAAHSSWGVTANFPCGIICEGGRATLSADVVGLWTSTPETSHVFHHVRGSGAAPLGFLDLTHHDPRGGWARPVAVESVAACEAAPGTFFVDDMTIYVHTYDGREPDEDVRVMLNAATARFANQVYLENVDIVGGLRAFHATHGAGDICCVDVSAGYDAAGNGAFQIQRSAATTCYMIRSVARHGFRDGFNYHWSGDSCCRVLEVDCLAFANGYQQESNSHNGTTMHDGGIAVRVNTAAIGNKNTQITDTNEGTQSWNLGCVAGSSQHKISASNSGNFVSGPGCVMWLQGCKSLGGSLSDFIVFEGGVMRVRDTDVATLKVNLINGTLERY